MLDLTHYRKAVEDLKANKFSCSEETINLACWLGERAYRLIDEIDRLNKAYEVLQAKNAVLTDACRFTLTHECKDDDCIQCAQVVSSALAIVK